MPSLDKQREVEITAKGGHVVVIVCLSFQWV